MISKHHLEDKKEFADDLLLFVSWPPTTDLQIDMISKYHLEDRKGFADDLLSFAGENSKKQLLHQPQLYSAEIRWRKFGL